MERIKISKEQGQILKTARIKSRKKLMNLAVTLNYNYRMISKLERGIVKSVPANALKPWLKEIGLSLNQLGVVLEDEAPKKGYQMIENRSQLNNYLAKVKRCEDESELSTALHFYRILPPSKIKAKITMIIYKFFSRKGYEDEKWIWKKRYMEQLFLIKDPRYYVLKKVGYKNEY